MEMDNLSMTLLGWEVIVVDPVTKVLRDRRRASVAEAELTVDHPVEGLLAVSRHE